MKLQLLGTASAEGMPGLFCRCNTCERARIAGGRNIRTRASALIDDRLKIDFPPDIFMQAQQHRLDLARIEAVLFTHGHDDHFSPAELQYRGRYFVEPAITRPLSLFGPPDVIEALRCALDPELVAYTLTTVMADRPAPVLDYYLFPFVANHDDSRICFNYMLTGPDGRKLLYASDTGWYPEATWGILERMRFDGALVECTKRDEGGYAGHMSIPEVIRMRQRLADTGALPAGAPMVATHFCHHMGMLHEELRSALEPHGITAGYDGLTLEIGRL
ncbi:MAG TPA: MBL fold metallo-hydrolase [Chthonomonadaceae bacterium]|nr:MBL fold metallo-hydrolase [Chthonomonadaceae bacterium]